MIAPRWSFVPPSMLQRRDSRSNERGSVPVGLGAVAALALLPHAVALVEPRHRDAGGVLAALGAGAAYALARSTTKLFSDDVDTGDWLGEPSGWA